ncbi:hypothetical protein N7520_005817 [Penicillium odoratum]|uniref:uncharacterized protein n=1 Tax=Penicillium odoratum TaxID=1167516 RepID=UPI00254796A3|nr:uncharacterized protein N7520_005817 [Penicillium odoratum]KAJ5758661.1 hypothetical protein N7520_005817 [Penicillium odoratum]
MIAGAKSGISESVRELLDVSMHRNSHWENPFKYGCRDPDCSERSKNTVVLLLHVHHKHPELVTFDGKAPVVECEWCKKPFSRPDALEAHRKVCKAIPEYTPPAKKPKRAPRGALKELREASNRQPGGSDNGAKLYHQLNAADALRLPRVDAESPVIYRGEVLYRFEGFDIFSPTRASATPDLFTSRKGFSVKPRSAAVDDDTNVTITAPATDNSDGTDHKTVPTHDAPTGILTGDKPTDITAKKPKPNDIARISHTQDSGASFELIHSAASAATGTGKDHKPWAPIKSKVRLDMARPLHDVVYNLSCSMTLIDRTMVAFTRRIRELGVSVFPQGRWGVY